MKSTLNALMKKLKWQLNEMEQELSVIGEKLEELKNISHEKDQKIQSASIPSSFILPEREIAGLHFIMKQQQELDDLKAQKAEFLAQKGKLELKKIRLNTELKMIEKHQENQLKINQQESQVQQQNLCDEWILQRRTSG